MGAGHDGGDDFESYGTGSPDDSRRLLCELHFHKATLVGYIELDLTSKLLTVSS